jgi:transposase-like protein
MWRSESLLLRSSHHPEDFMAKTRRKRHSYSNAKRISILQAARDQGLTALDVKKRFGVTPVTYYSWRRKYGAGSNRATTLRAAGRVGRVGGVGSGIAGQLRTEVQSRVREILPQIVRHEVSNYLDSLFGSSRGRGRKI